MPMDSTEGWCDETKPILSDSMLTGTCGSQHAEGPQDKSHAPFPKISLGRSRAEVGYPVGVFPPPGEGSGPQHHPGAWEREPQATGAPSARSKGSTRAEKAPPELPPDPPRRGFPRIDGSLGVGNNWDDGRDRSKCGSCPRGSPTPAGARR